MICWFALMCRASALREPGLNGLLCAISSDAPIPFHSVRCIIATDPQKLVAMCQMKLRPIICCIVFSE